MPRFVSHIGRLLAFALLVTVFLVNIGSSTSAQEPKAKEGESKEGEAKEGEAEEGEAEEKEREEEVLELREAVLVAFKAVDKVAIKIQALETDTTEKRNAIKSDGSKEGDAKAKKARVALLEVYLKEKVELTKTFLKAQSVYIEAFQKTEITSWKTREEALDARVLQTACLMMIRHYTSERNFDKVAIANYWLLKYARTSTLMAQGLRGLNAALPLMRSYESAKSYITEIYDLKIPTQNLAAKLLRADIEAIHGNYDRSKEIWNGLLAKELKDAKRGSTEALARATGDMLVTYLGKPAPKLKSEKWLGARKRSLKGLRPNIVVLNFFSTAIDECLLEVPGLHRIQERFKDEQVKVLGLTQLYTKGQVPLSLEQLETGNGKIKVLKSMNAKQAVSHLKEFRKNTDLSYPFVLMSDKEATAFSVSLVPQTMVVDHEGVVAYIWRVNQEGRITRVVERLIEARSAERKADEAAKKKAEGK